MAQLGVYSIDCNTQINRSAASWVAKFYPDIRAHSHGELVELRSDIRTDQELALIWSCAQANERLLETNADMRAALMRELLQ